MERIKYILPLNIIKSDNKRKYYCPKCGSDVHKYHNDYYDMDIRFICNSCDYMNENENEFLNNKYTEWYDKIKSWDDEKRNRNLEKYKQKLKKEKEYVTSAIESYGSELAGDIFRKSDELRKKIEIIHNIESEKK